MAKLKDPHKIIAIYSTAKAPDKTDYAVNLSVALAALTKKKVLFIDAVRPFEGAQKLLRARKGAEGEITAMSEIGIDILSLSDVQRSCIEKIRERYGYIITDLPVDIDETIFEMLFYSDSLHFFVSSSQEELKKGHDFLEDLLRRGLKEIHTKLRVVVNRLNIFDKFSLDEISWLLKRDIWSTIPEPGILEMPIDQDGRPIALKLKECAYSNAIFHIAKKESGELLGLALGGGGAFGLAHIGVLKVLERNKIEVDMMSGSSIGALIAAMWGIGLSSDKIERISQRLRLKLNIMRLLDFTVPISGILSGRRIKSFLKSILGEKTFEDLKIPVKIMVYDLANREVFTLEKGKLVDAVYMSIAIPGIFKPRVERERVIVDGGVSDPVPVDALIKRGVDKIIAVNVLPGPEDIYERNRLIKGKLEKEEYLLQNAVFYKRYGLRIKRFFRKIFSPNIFDVIITSMQAMEYILAEDSCRRASVALHPVLSRATSIDFHLVEDFVKRGEEEAERHIEAIKKLD